MKLGDGSWKYNSITGVEFQAQMKLTAWDTALASIRQVLRTCFYSVLRIISFQVLKIQPNNEKALFRKAKILQEKHQLDEAIGFHSKLGLVLNFKSIGILRRINRLYPANKQCHTELAKLTNKVRVRSLSFDCQYHF